MTDEERRLADLQRQLEEQRQAEIRKQVILRKLLTPKARQRLTNLKIVRPEFVNQLETQLITLAAGGKVEVPINDSKLKSILMGLQTGRREIKIRKV
ncbi:MAG: DNA-binding protein [Candidatus Bathyarchaeia archaeon]